MLSFPTAANESFERAWAKLVWQASAELQQRWAKRFEYGENAPADMTRALTLYCLAARRDNIAAQYQLGWIYAHGRGVERNTHLAAYWFGRAADQGDRPARMMLRRIGAAPAQQTASCIGPKGQSLLNASIGADAKRSDIERAVRALAPEFGLEPELVLAVIQVESGFALTAKSPKGALGLMQLIPATAQRFGVADPLDPLQNLKGGMAYLSWLLDHFEGDLKRALAGYNAGENAVLRYGGVPPYAETRNYLKKIARLYPKATS
jgi:soluble lytic murein transglycosylase-like protein